MAPIGTYWGVLRQPNTRVVLSVAALNGLELEQPAFDFTAKPEGFMEKFPYGKIPAFEGADGFKLIEGMAIARYLCGLGNKVNLLGSDAKETALIEQWIHFAEQEIGFVSYNMMGLVFGFSGPFNSEMLQKQTERLVRALDHVEAHLKASSSGYLVGNCVTLADLTMVSAVYAASFVALGVKEREKYSHVFAHYDKVGGDEKVKAFWGKEYFTEVAATEPRKLPSF